MANLLHIDSSVTGDASVTRRMTARAAAAWQTANPGGTVTDRDLGANPVPHLTSGDGNVFLTPPDQHTPHQAETYALGIELAEEIKNADAMILGLPLYNFGPPSSVKAWIDHLIIPGVTVDLATMTGLLDTPLYVMVARGGGYAEGTPRHGWDHAAAWLPHGVAMTGLEPRLVIAELTLAKVNPAMADLIPLAEESMTNAEAEIDALFSAATV